jgi:hypothetical protein
LEAVGESRQYLDMQKAGDWSHGESNPDLLNAIQLIGSPNISIHHELRDESGKTIAPSVAQQALLLLYEGAMRGASLL